MSYWTPFLLFYGWLAILLAGFAIWLIRTIDRRN